MGKNLLRPVRASQLSRALGLELLGEDREIRELCGLDALTGHGLSFSRDRRPGAGCTGTVFASEPPGSGSLTVLRSEKPRLEFIRAQHMLQESPGFEDDASPPDIHPTARIGTHAVIESGVSIGEGTHVGSLAVIKSGTRIGRHCDIKSGAVIGEAGFGFERDGANRPLRMIHIGRVVIGDHVEIDDHCHISHNCRIGEGAMITAGVAISGSVTIGRDAWLAPGCALVQKVSVGAEAFVGIGSVVTRSVPAGARVFGNPARPIPSLPGPPRRHGPQRRDA